MKLMRDCRAHDRRLDEAEWLYLIAMERCDQAEKAMTRAVAAYKRAGVTLIPAPRDQEKDREPDDPASRMRRSDGQD